MATRRKGRLCAMIGGQYGSEGKGVIAAYLAGQFDVHVRVGSHNAGHSFRAWQANQWNTWKMQQIPVGWINPRALLVLGRGALINPETLVREINEIEAVDPTIHSRLFIDPLAGVLEKHHHEAEGGVEGEIHNRIGSTGEGVGAARIARLRRDPSHFRRFVDFVEHEREYAWLGQYLCPGTPAFLRSRLDGGLNVFLEGSQGVGLSITHGPWPYVTTTDCGAAQLCADVGLPPTRLDDVLCVVRTFPIRVAGNSGPLRNEITWKALSLLAGRDVEERTTVTNKVRRVGLWDQRLVDAAVTLNAPTSFALMFADYLDPDCQGTDDPKRLGPEVEGFIERNLELPYGIPVAYVGTGGPHWSVVERM